MTIAIIKTKIADHCLVNGLNETNERISATAAIIHRIHGSDKSILALDSLIAHSPFFPAPANITAELAKLENQGIGVDEKAIEQMDKIIKTIHDFGFDPAAIEIELGAELYSLIGGANRIKEYGSGETEVGTFKAQLRGSIKAWLSAKQGKGRIEIVEKIAGAGAVAQVMSEGKAGLKAIDFSQYGRNKNKQLDK